MQFAIYKFVGSLSAIYLIIILYAIGYVFLYVIRRSDIVTPVTGDHCGNQCIKMRLKDV